jgi:hypothetical protein
MLAMAKDGTVYGEMRFTGQQFAGSTRESLEAIIIPGTRGPG